MFCHEYHSEDTLQEEADLHAHATSTVQNSIHTATTAVALKRVRCIQLLLCIHIAVYLHTSYDTRGVQYVLVEQIWRQISTAVWNTAVHKTYKILYLHFNLYKHTGVLVRYIFTILWFSFGFSRLFLPAFLSLRESLERPPFPFKRWPSSELMIKTPHCTRASLPRHN